MMVGGQGDPKKASGTCCFPFRSDLSPYTPFVLVQSSYKSLEGSVSELEAARECLTARIGEVEACLAGVSAERDQLAADAEAQSRELVLAREEAEKIAQELATLAAEHSALVDQLRAAEEGARRADELAAELEKVKAEQAQVGKPSLTIFERVVPGSLNRAA